MPSLRFASNPHQRHLPFALHIGILPTFHSNYCINIMRSNKDAEAEVRSWGYSHVFTWTDSANGTTKPQRSQQ